jgi:hypothetical protein
MHGDKRGFHKAVVGRSEEKRPLVRPRFRREHNIKMDFQELGWGKNFLDRLTQVGTHGGLL